MSQMECFRSLNVAHDKKSKTKKYFFYIHLKTEISKK